MSRPLQVLTVCLGNICRSPTAEAAIREAAADAGLSVTVRSAGTGTWHLGDPPDPRMSAAAADARLPLDGVAEPVTTDAIEAADLVVVMDRSNLTDVERLALTSGSATPIRLLRSFDDASRQAEDLEVPDPYLGGEEGFRLVVEQCRTAAAGVVAHLAGERPDPGPC